MIDLLKKLLDLALRFLDWRRDTAKARDRNAARRAIAEHDAEALNRLIQARKDARRDRS